MRDLCSLPVSSANGAPLHLLRREPGARTRRAQALSVFAHGAAVAAVFLAASYPPGRDVPAGQPPRPGEREPIRYTPLETLLGTRAGRSSGGGDRNPVPATKGDLPPHSFLALLGPRLPDDARHILTVPVAVPDAEAPAFPNPVADIGLSWMTARTGSAGPGDRHSLGDGKGRGIGDLDGDSDGQDGGSRTRGNVRSAPGCAYCPDPQYTDEARQLKIQGSVTLRVLVGADGRAAEIRLEQGLGYGLDERAVQTIRGWRFLAARDAARRPVASWITVEAVYRLF